MRIAFLTPTLELHGGTLVMFRYAEHFAAIGHEVTIISPKSPVECVIPQGVKVVTYAEKSSKIVFYSFQLAYLEAVTKALKSGFDVVIPIFTPLAVHAVYARWRLKAKFRVVVFFQDFFEMLWVGKYLRFILKRQALVKRFDKVVAVSRGIADEFQAVSGVKPLTIPNGIEDVFYNGSRGPKGRYILFVGRPGKSKGFDVFEKAMALVAEKAPDVKATLISTEVPDGKLGAVQTVRYQNREQLRRLYAEALVYVHAAIGESFGLPPLEAMAAGAAAVVTSTTGTNDYARDNENCLAARYGDHEGLARNILRLIHDEPLRLRLEEGGRKTAAEYRWANSLAKFEQVVTGSSN